MTIEHPSQTALQQFALNDPECSKEVATHIGQCKSCQQDVAIYQLMLSEIKHQPRPAFDFEIADMIMPQIQAGKVTTREPILPYFITVAIFCMVAIPLYIFWRNILFMFAGLSSFFIYISVAFTIIILAYSIFKTYRRYEQKMQAINFY